MHAHTFSLTLKFSSIDSIALRQCGNLLDFDHKFRYLPASFCADFDGLTPTHFTCYSFSTMSAIVSDSS